MAGVRRRGVFRAAGALVPVVVCALALASTALGSSPPLRPGSGPVRGSTAAARASDGGIVSSAIDAGRGATTDGGRMADSVLAASAAPPPLVAAWAPEPPVYSVFTWVNVPVKMDDGVLLRADLLYPADPATGVPAHGPFPVLLAQTPYGKTLSGPDPYLVQRGFIEAIVDVRGTGASHGHWGLLDPEQTRDAVRLVHWAAGLPHSTGAVGLFGASYLGINQLLTAAAVGPSSPLKAIFPMVAANDVYRDAAVMGGLPDAEFFDAFLGFTAGLNAANPVKEGTASGPNPATPAEVAALESEHLDGVTGYHAAYLTGLEATGDLRFDGPYWGARRPHDVLSAIVANHIPAYLVGGWHDLFQRGEPLNFVGLQNAWAGRPVDTAMTPRQRVTGRYQLLMGPWYHATFGQGVDLERLQLEWFDTWLRAEPTGMDRTPTPLHVFDLGTGRYKEAAAWPLPGAAPTRLYLGAGRSGTAGSVNDGSLSVVRPGAPGTDAIAFAGISSACNAATDQWSLTGPVAAPCDRDDRSVQAGPSALTYTTGAFATPVTLAGPLGARILATSTTPDTEWVVTVEDVAPDGTSTALTEGALLGSVRAVDPARSWRCDDGAFLLPFHPSLPATASFVPPGQLAAYDVEILPTLATIGVGHRLRVTISTSDTPHLLPTVAQLANLVGGVYQVHHSPEAASFVEIPLLTGAR